MYDWVAHQVNRIAFVMVNAGGIEVPGLGSTLGLQLSKNGASFVNAAGTQNEIGNGWYTYLSTLAEADSPGVISVRANGAGCMQQNLEYVVGQRTPLSVPHTFTVARANSTPISNATVTVTLDSAGLQPIARGISDTLGHVVFLLDPGTYYFWASAYSYSFMNPTTEAVV